MAFLGLTFFTKSETIILNRFCQTRHTQTKRIYNMDTQLQNYQALKNGVPVPMSKGTLQEVVDWIRVLESGLDRYTQHSPYTIARI